MANTKFLDYNGLSKLVEKIKNTYVNKNEQYEANLKWGGRNFDNSYGPIDAAMIPELGANRFAFGNPKGITIEYSNDAGKTWKDYGASNLQKLRLTTIGDGFTIGKVKSSTPANDMLRITFDTTSNNGISCYTILNKFVIFISTSGSQECYCTIQGAIYNTQNTFEDIVTKVGIAGWTGYNVINTKSINTSSGSGQPDRYSKIRFIFGCSNTDENRTGLQIISIYAFGGVGWVTPSNMAKYGRLYYFDEAQNATFPANVTATNFIGSATYADKYSYNGMDRDFVYDAVDSGNHYIRCKDATIIRANETNLNKYAFIINSDGKGGCYIYDSTNAKGTTWGPNGITFEKAPANSLVAANGTFITAITNTEIQNEIDKAITL